MMAAVRAMKASWISWRIARRMRRRAEPVQQAIAGSAIYRCCPPLVAGGGPRGGPRRPTGLSWVFFILAGIAAATAVQQLYQRVFGQDSRGLPDRLRAVIWLGMLAVFSVIFSGMVISYDQKYGPIGVVFGLMSFFIAVGVVIILGAAVGLMWQDRGLSFRAAVGKLRRAS